MAGIFANAPHQQTKQQKQHVEDMKCRIAQIELNDIQLIGTWRDSQWGLYKEWYIEEGIKEFSVEIRGKQVKL